MLMTYNKTTKDVVLKAKLPFEKIMHTNDFFSWLKILEFSSWFGAENAVSLYFNIVETTSFIFSCQEYHCDPHHEWKMNHEGQWLLDQNNNSLFDLDYNCLIDAPFSRPGERCQRDSRCIHEGISVISWVFSPWPLRSFEISWKSHNRPNAWDNFLNIFSLDNYSSFSIGLIDVV